MTPSLMCQLFASFESQLVQFNFSQIPLKCKTLHLFFVIVFVLTYNTTVIPPTRRIEIAMENKIYRAMQFSRI